MPNPVQRRLVVFTLLLVAASFIGGKYLHDQPLHHIPTAIGLVYLWRVAARGTFSNSAVLAIHIFIWLHTLGARYIYSFVPYDDWASAVTGHTLSALFHSSRNHYDRLVHFSFGLLAMLPFVEIFRRITTRGRAVLLGIAMVAAVSALYEIVEWCLSMLVAPDMADRYNGQQGDMWDAQKDMALAIVGSILVGFGLLLQRDRSDVLTSK